MSILHDNYSQKRSNSELLQKVLTRIYSFIIPNSIKVRRLKKIEEKAKIIAKENRIPFPFRCNITYRKGKNFHSVGYCDKSKPAVDGKFNIYIYSPYVMSSELQILITIFHEYGHFLHDRTPNDTIFSLIKIYVKKDFFKYKAILLKIFANFLHIEFLIYSSLMKNSLNKWILPYDMHF
jgi:hypothetical protein